MGELPRQLGLGTVMVSAASALCGDRICELSEYCSADGFCNSCSDICNTDSHNYDHTTCATKCSDYNFAMMYVKRSDFEAAVKDLQMYAVLSLILSLAAVLVVLVVLSTVWLKYQRLKYPINNNEKQIKKKMETIKAICVNEMENPKRIKLDIPAPMADKDTPPSALTTMTPLSRRHPSEDATLEFAYDNPTLTHSPTLGANTPDTTPKNNRTETTF